MLHFPCVARWKDTLPKTRKAISTIRCELDLLTADQVNTRCLIELNYYFVNFVNHSLISNVFVQITWRPWARWALEADNVQDQGIAWDWSRQRVVLVVLGEVAMYHGER